MSGAHEQAIAVVRSALERQAAKGHTPASDAERSLAHMAAGLIPFAQEARDVAMPGDRQDLGVAHRRAARLAAYAIAVMVRIEHEVRT
jgi:hypothetical protein